MSLVGTILGSRVFPIFIIIIVLLPVAFIATQPATITDTHIEKWKNPDGPWEGRVILDDTHYLTSWLPNTDSETITGQGYILLNDFTGAILLTLGWPVYYRYEFNVQEVPVKYFPFHNTPSAITIPDPSGSDSYWFEATPILYAQILDFWHPLESFNVELQGELTAELKVQMEVLAIVGGEPHWGSSTLTLRNAGWDGAFLQSGRGEIYLYGDQGPFEEGESAEIFVRTGFTKLPEGWFVKLYPPIDRPELFDPDIIANLPDDTQRIITVTIEENWFEIGSSNEFRVELWNEFFDIGFSQLFTIDQRERAPGTPELNRTLELDVATYTATSRRTFADIEEFVVYAWYGDNTMPSEGDGESWVLQGQSFPAGQPSGLNYTVTFEVRAKNKEGNIMVKVMSRDVDGRSSAPAFDSIIVEEGKVEPNGGGLTQPFLWTPFVFLIIIIGIIVGLGLAIAIARTNPDRVPLGLVLFAISVIIAGLLAWAVGSNPDLALTLGYTWFIIRAAFGVG